MHSIIRSTTTAPVRRSPSSANVTTQQLSVTDTKETNNVKRTLIMLTALLGSSMALAQASDKGSTLIPAMSVIPVVVVEPGLLTTAQVLDFVGPNQNAGSFQKANAKVVARLVERKCQVTVQVIKKLDESRVYRYFSGTEASVSCTEVDGSTSSIVIGGNLVSDQGALDLKSLERGTKAYFLVNGAGLI